VDAIELSYSVQESDMLVAMRRQVLNSRPLRQRLRRSYLILVAAFALMALGSWLLAPGALVAPVLAVMALCTAVFYPILARQRLEACTRRMVHAYATPEALALRRLRSDGEWLEEVTEHSQSRLALSAVEGVEVSDGQAIVRAQGVPFMLIPRERVTAGDFDTFVGALQDAATQARNRKENK
jgi:hypothetical protein